MGNCCASLPVATHASDTTGQPQPRDEALLAQYEDSSITEANVSNRNDNINNHTNSSSINHHNNNNNNMNASEFNKPSTLPALPPILQHTNNNNIDGADRRVQPLPRTQGLPTILSNNANADITMEEVATDTFHVSSTTASDDQRSDAFSVEVSMPTQSLLIDRVHAHVRTFSDLTSEIDFTTASLDRSAILERRGTLFNARDRERHIISAEMEGRARIVRSMLIGRRVLTTRIYKELVAHRRAADLRMFFLERLALMLIITPQLELMSRVLCQRAERQHFTKLTEQAAASVAAVRSPAGGGKSPVKSGATSTSAQAMQDDNKGAAANLTSSVDASADEEEEDGEEEVVPVAHMMSPPSSNSLRVGSVSGRPSSAPTKTARGAASQSPHEDVMSSSLERGTQLRRSCDGDDIRRIMQTQATTTTTMRTNAAASSAAAAAAAAVSARVDSKIRPHSRDQHHHTHHQSLNMFGSRMSDVHQEAYPYGE